MSENKNDKKFKWHSMEVDSVLEELKASKDKGLAEDEVQKRLEKYGENKIPEKKKRN